MKQTVSIPVKQVKTSPLSMWLSSENHFFSSVLEKTVLNRQVLHLAHCVTAFCFMAIAANFSLVATILGFLWFIASIASAKKGGMS